MRNIRAAREDGEVDEERSLEATEEAVKERMQQLEQRLFPFLNYFGMQRFGNGVTHSIGREVLARDWKKVRR